jgi:outer membrane protein TolC
MKKIFLILTLILAASNIWAATRTITLNDVVQRVSADNYVVYQNALRVYQAKTNIEKARADLLPRLNLWSIAGIILDPTSIFDRITDIAPFLVPSNWFRLEENKLLYLAEKEGYRALWGNEVHVAKTLYKHVTFDEKILEHVKVSIRELERIHRIVKTRETFGGATPGTARDIEIKILGLQEDRQNLEVLLAQELDELTYMLAFPANDQITLTPVTLPQVDSLSPINTQEYEFRLLSTSPERRQFEHFLSVLVQIKNEIQYAFLGVSDISRGVAGGIFDSMPTPNGLGFGNQAATNIVEAQKQIILSQRLGVEETLKRQLRLVGTQYNSDLNNYTNFKKRVELSRQSKDAILRRLQLGEDINVVELSENSRNQIQAETALYAVQFRVSNSMDRIQRLIFDGDYSMSPPLIDSLKGVAP